jgi:hypothetical protein
MSDIKHSFWYDLKDFINESIEIIKNEHKQMPKTCGCGGTLKPYSQALLVGGYDEIGYRCEECGKLVVKIFKLPENYIGD